MWPFDAAFSPTDFTLMRKNRNEIVVVVAVSCVYNFVLIRSAAVTAFQCY